MLKTTTNVTEYRKVMDDYARARGKSHAEVIERAAQQANFRLVASEKRGGVPRAKLGMFPLGATANPDKGGRTYKQRFYFALMASRGVKKGAGGAMVMLPAARRAYARRRSAKGAMAAGFLVSARKLGLKKRGPKGAQPRQGGSASRSSARRPVKKTGGYRAESINAVKGSYEVGKTPMDRAISATLRDMRQFANKILQETNNQFQRR